MRSFYRVFVVVLVMTFSLAAWARSDDSNTPAPPSPSRSEAASERIFLQEAKLVETMHGYTPLVETYIQRLKPDNDLWTVPDKDRYFLGRLVLDKKLNNQAFKDHNKSRFMSRVLDRLDSFYRINYKQVGFMQTIFLGDQFDKDHYNLKYVRQQFLGEVRTLVFDVVPRPHSDELRFQGRIWVEDQDYNIVRINGTYGPNTETKYYFHFDSWRTNMQPGLWLPAYAYTEESDAERDAGRKLAMKGQTRLWGYDLKHSGRQSEFTAMQVESNDVTDNSTRGSNEIVPVQSQHLWEREAEDNVLDRMERAGILAPDGDVSKVLQTVVNNLEITNNLNIEPEVRCRVLLTTPLESFTVGNTIVISRGLLDVLPDESSLATVLARELGHIALGHRMNTKYAFSDRMLFPDEQVFMDIDMVQNEKDEQAADQKGLELLQNSPYKEKLASAGLFLRVLGSRSPELTWLVSPHFGNRLAKKSPIRMAAMAQAPALEVRNVAQVPALPLGSRIKLDPWDDHVEMLKSKAVALRSVRDKMSFEVTPMYPNLVSFNPSKGSEIAAKPAQ
ncbi:MAG TPA: M48 family metalloprotease [Candidatus Angelobacter sp.]|nr:M48 family metalloprotease [Candidatus Angelobacter sp.]